MEVGGPVDPIDPDLEIRRAFGASRPVGGGHDVEPSAVRVDQPAVMGAIVFEIESSFGIDAGRSRVDGHDQTVVAAVDLKTLRRVREIIREEAVAALRRPCFHEKGHGHVIGAIGRARAEDDVP